MKKLLYLILITFLSANFCLGYGSKSKEILNKTNFASYFRDYLGFPYDSHGCLHFSPSDIYLLYKTIPTGTKLVIKPYSDKSPGFIDSNLSFFDHSVMNEDDVKKYAALFNEENLSILVYPSLSRLYILLDNRPYVKMSVHPGPSYGYLMLEDVEKNRPLKKDFMRATPTDPGTYRILEKTDYYRSPTYSGITEVPFGALMKKIGGVWKYRQDKRELPVPQFIQDDLTQVEDNRYYSYFDPSYNDNGELVSIKWVGNDFGKYVITWTKDGRNRYPDIGYCAGQLLFEQLTLVGQIADILTKTGSSEFDGLAANSRVFSQCKNTYNFVSTSGRQGSLMPAEEAFCRLYNGIPLTSRDSEVLDPRLKNAYDLYRSGDLPKNRRDREDVISLYNYLRIYNETIVKQANWYKKLKDDWSFWGALRESLTLDFDTEGIPPGARKKIVEGWINDRLEFRTIN